jgi:hypothetical protein
MNFSRAVLNNYVLMTKINKRVSNFELLLSSLQKNFTTQNGKLKIKKESGAFLSKKNFK